MEEVERQGSDHRCDGDDDSEGETAGSFEAPPLPLAGCRHSQRSASNAKDYAGRDSNLPDGEKAARDPPVLFRRQAGGEGEWVRVQEGHGAAEDTQEDEDLRYFEELADFLSSEEEDFWHPCHLPAPSPHNEPARLRALHEYGILDSEPDEHLQCLVTLAQRTFKTSMAWIALIDRDREWYLAKTGIAYAQTHRDIAFGAHSILQSDGLWVDDATVDERFKYNKLVLDQPLIRFYLSYPLTLVSDGQRYPIGCLVVADQEPRCKFSHPTANDQRLLQTLAAAVVQCIEMMPRMHSDSPGENMTDPANRNAVLRRFMSVAGVDMTAHLTSELSRRLYPRVVPMGKYVCRKGDQDNSMYFVVSGRCACLVNSEPMEFLGKGSCFGEVAIMNSCKMKAAGIPNDVLLRRVARTADIRALERCELLELRFVDAWPLIKEIPVLWSKLEGISKMRSGKIAVRKNKESSD